MNHINKKLIGLILISPAVLFVVGFIIFAFYVTYMTEPLVLLIVGALIAIVLLFVYGAGMLVK